MGPVYYFTGHPYNTISLGALKFYVGFQKVTSEHIEHYYSVDPQGCSWRSPNQTQNNLDFIQIEIIKFNPHRDSNIVVLTVCALSKNNFCLLVRVLLIYIFLD